MKIITISGLDGSGKSTQLKILKKKLTNQGYRVFNFHMIDFSIANKILGKKQKNESDKPKAKIKAGKISITLRKIALIIDLKRFKKLTKKIDRKNEFDFLITDRYFYDQIVNIMYLEKSDPKKDSYWKKQVEKLLIVPDFKFYIKTEPKIIAKRNAEIEQGIDYLNEKNILYNHLSTKWNLNIINGNETIENIQEEVLKEIKELI